MFEVRWIDQHSIVDHIVAPLWLRVPEKLRWRIVNRLDRSQDRAWCNLVDAALAEPEEDACDVSNPLRSTASHCKTDCHFFGHSGEHDCACYCGKFEFRAMEGYDDRTSMGRPHE